MSDFRATRLWKATLAPQKRDPHAAPRERLRNVLEKFRERAAVLAGEIPQDVRDLTVHDITHIDALWETTDVIAGTELSFTPTEAFVLGGAFLIHDLGMGLAAYPGGLAELQANPQWNDLLVGLLRAELGRDPDANELANPPTEAFEQVKFWMLRTLHADQAERLAQTSWIDPQNNERFHLLEDPELRAAFGPLIGRIAHSHWWPTAQLPERLPPRITGAPVSFPNTWVIDELKLALILRVADVAHLDGRRAPAFLKALRRPSGPSELHWVFQDKLHQLQRDGDRLVYTSRSFERSEAQAWWLCYETLRTVDTEMRRADDLNADLQRERFAARGVRGVEDPNRLRLLIPTSGWLPVDAQVRVGHVASLVSKLGGQQLYGSDQSVPLRELIQNAADALRARRILESRGETWGDVSIELGADENGPWLEVQDNGVGMSTEVLTGPFLDFGVSFWSTPDAAVQFPSLLARGFQSTGRYGIGFFSVFMWADRVRVTTRRYDEAMRETRVLEFEKGLDIRPLLRPAEPSEFIRDGGTRVRAWPRGISDGGGRWIRMPTEGFSFREWTTDPFSAAQRLCPTLDVNLIARTATGDSQMLVAASDWLDMTGENLLRRTNESFRSEISFRVAGNRVRPLMHNGRVVGRAAIVPGSKGCTTIGGFRSGTQISIAGVLLGESLRASRDEASVLVSPEELARWATEQADLISRSKLSKEVKAKCARLIGCLGGDPTNLPLGRADGVWLGFEELVEWSRRQESIIIINESDESKARQLGGTRLRRNVLVEPLAEEGLFPYSPFSSLPRRHAKSWAGGQRPTLRAIANAWAPEGICVWQGEFEIDDDESVSLDAEEVRREGL